MYWGNQPKEVTEVEKKTTNRNYIQLEKHKYYIITPKNLNKVCAPKSIINNKGFNENVVQINSGFWKTETTTLIRRIDATKKEDLVDNFLFCFKQLLQAIFS